MLNRKYPVKKSTIDTYFARNKKEKWDLVLNWNIANITVDENDTHTILDDEVITLSVFVLGISLSCSIWKFHFLYVEPKRTHTKQFARYVFVRFFQGMSFRERTNCYTEKWRKMMWQTKNFYYNDCNLVSKDVIAQYLFFYDVRFN